MTLAGLLALLLPLQPAACTPPPNQIVVLAAASLVDVLPQIAEKWTASSGVRVAFGFDASSRLARQAEAGAPADVFISADENWVDYLTKKGVARVGSRRRLAGNRLVAVVPAGSKLTASTAAGLAASVRRLALAGENVPAGRYAKAALESLQAWTVARPKVVRADSVRAALLWVAEGEVDAGIVYATDAASEPRVKVAFAFPESSHAPIVYPGVVLRGSSRPEDARRFLAFCAGPHARALWRAAGFSAPPRR